MTDTTYSLDFLAPSTNTPTLLKWGDDRVSTATDVNNSESRGVTNFAKRIIADHLAQEMEDLTTWKSLLETDSVILHAVVEKEHRTGSAQKDPEKPHTANDMLLTYYASPFPLPLSSLPALSLGALSDLVSNAESITGFNPSKSLNPSASSLMHAISLEEALDDLNSIDEEVQEEGFETPSQTVRLEAERLLREVHFILPRRYEIFPTYEGHIVIYAKFGTTRSFMIHCESDGGVACFVNINGRRRRSRYDSGKHLPDDFIREALKDFGESV